MRTHRRTALGLLLAGRLTALFAFATSPESGAGAAPAVKSPQPPSRHVETVPTPGATYVSPAKHLLPGSERYSGAWGTTHRAEILPGGWDVSAVKHGVTAAPNRNCRQRPGPRRGSRGGEARHASPGRFEPASAGFLRVAPWLQPGGGVSLSVVRNDAIRTGSVTPQTAADTPLPWPAVPRWSRSAAPPAAIRWKRGRDPRGRRSAPSPGAHSTGRTPDPAGCSG
ncbi:MAG: hypothetical protein K0Q72_2313 [Armatimonadetes bacterium]|nr:hypothetical protein [Armatimonadota bacterium]